LEEFAQTNILYRAFGNRGINEVRMALLNRGNFVCEGGKERGRLG
jgi:hypothetical protein